MNVLVIGSGAREHAIVWKLAQSSRVQDIFIAPGNGGTAFLGRNLDVQPNDILGLAAAARNNNVELTIVGPEVPLSLGLVDAFQRQHFRVFGPTQAAARIEWSKSFAKDLMVRHGIPCATSASFEDHATAQEYLYRVGTPVVIKADGLAAGKGVLICHTPEEAESALDAILVKHTFGAAGSRVVIEEYLEGPEVTLMAFTDGEACVPMVPASDYKRIYDGDLGPNTGGMGSYSPPPFFGREQIEYVQRAVLDPALRALREEGAPFVGVLYAGLMLTADGPKVLEFNSRFGDPETQVVLPRLKTDLLDVFLACVNGNLGSLHITWDEQPCVGVVMASEGYPGKYETGFAITGLDQLDDGVRVFHAGTETQKMQSNSGLRRLWASDLPSTSMEQLLSGNVLTSGGRVLSVVTCAPTLEAARRKVYANIDRIQFTGAYYRKDIGIPATLPDEWQRRADRPALTSDTTLTAPQEETTA